MNTHMIIGRLVKDAEARSYQDGKMTARFVLAVNRTYKRENGPDADFFQLVAFGKTAEAAEKYFRKGVKIYARYREENNNYTDQTGRTIYQNARILEEWEFVESKKNQETGSAPAGDDFMQVPEGEGEELPFV